MACSNFLIVIAALVAFSDAVIVSDFQQVGGPFNGSWSSLDPVNVRIGLAYANGKIYAVSRRGVPREDGTYHNFSSLNGGIVSILDTSTGNWSHNPFAPLSDDHTLRDELLTLADRLFMLVFSKTDAIRYVKLYCYSDDGGEWTSVDNFDIDPNSFQSLARGDNMFFQADVPDQSGNVAYITATDHEMASTDSHSTISLLRVQLDGTTPVNASIKLVKGIDTPPATAVIATAAKDGLLSVFYNHFSPDSNNVSTLSVGKIVNLTTGEMIDAVGSIAQPEIGFAHRHVYQVNDQVIILGQYPHSGERRVRHIWLLDLTTQQYQETDAIFPSAPFIVSTFDDKNKIFAAHMNIGVYSATITRS